MEKVDFSTKKIERMAFVPFDRYGSRASNNGKMSFRSPPNQEKSDAQGAENGRFCTCKLTCKLMGILVTLSLSKKKAPIGRKKYFC